MEGKIVKKVVVEKEVAVKTGDILVWHPEGYGTFTKVAVVDAISNNNACLCLLYVEFDKKTWFKAETNIIVAIPVNSDLEVIPREKFDITLIQDGINGTLQSISRDKSLENKVKRMIRLQEAVQTVIAFHKNNVI